MDGVKPSWDPDEYARNAGFNVTLAGPILERLAPGRGERILDLGCGDGALTAQLIAQGCEVVGLDQSEAQVAAARARGIDARVGDAQRLPFEREFDAVFSNAALHWMPDPEAVIKGVARALRPGGRFVAEFGGHGCVAAIRVGLHAVVSARGIDPGACDPWYFPTADDYAARLEGAGFTVAHIELTPRPTPLPTGLAGWLDTFAAPFLGALPVAERVRARDAVIALVTPVLSDARGCVLADYVRLRFVARLA